MMKKMVLTAIMLVLSIAYCSAAVPESELSLGGIYYQAPKSYVEGIYGSPTSIGHGGYYEDIWRYGESVSIGFVHNKVRNISVRANNGFATPAGVTVGMKRSTVYKIYGNPLNSDNTFMYYRTERSKYVGMKFTFKNGVITSISIGEFD